MTNEFTLLHRSGPERFALPHGEAGLFSFQTCLRHIVIADSEVSKEMESSTLEHNDRVLRGEEAYRFLLQVICGLHSPLVGETEVYGQFKNAAAAFSLPTTPWGSSLSRVFKWLFEDAKRIRQAHLEDLGSQSYGSVLRREMKGMKRVHVIGAGHLVQEILPWIAKDGIQTQIHARNPEKALQDMKAFAQSRVSISDIEDGTDLEVAEALIVAAPVSAAWLSKWLKTSSIKFIADLRSDSHLDRVSVANATVLDLGQIMSRISSNQTLLETRKAAAIAAIEAAANERARSIEYRPFGWEDLSA